jgi:hypothetical protein
VTRAEATPLVPLSPHHPPMAFLSWGHALPTLRRWSMELHFWPPLTTGPHLWLGLLNNYAYLWPLSQFFLWLKIMLISALKMGWNAYFASSCQRIIFLNILPPSLYLVYWGEWLDLTSWNPQSWAFGLELPVTGLQYSDNFLDKVIILAAPPLFFFCSILFCF